MPLGKQLPSAECLALKTSLFASAVLFSLSSCLPLPVPGLGATDSIGVGLAEGCLWPVLPCKPVDGSLHPVGCCPTGLGAGSPWEGAWACVPLEGGSLTAWAVWLCGTTCAGFSPPLNCLHFFPLARNNCVSPV